MARRDMGVLQIFCPECGKELPSGNDFCRFCGTELGYVKPFLKGNSTYHETDNDNGGIVEEAGTEAGLRAGTGPDDEVGSVVGADNESISGQAAVWVKEGNMHAATAIDSLENAIRCYTTAIGLDPSCREAWDGKVEALFHLGRNEEAQACQENVPRPREEIREKPVSGEIYVGGISSPSLKRGNSKGGLDIAGSIGANMGGYGVYVTDRRLFIVKNQELVYGHPKGPRLGGFIKEELFGGTVTTGKGTIDQLETIEIPKDEILKIELKKPMMLSGFVAFTTLNSGNPRLFIDHRQVYDSIRVLMLKFYPERTSIIT
jgi:hypothetical protein